MTTRTRVFLLAAIFLSAGCNPSVVGLDFSPEWNCLRARHSIELYRELDLSSEPPKLVGPSGVFDPGKGARVVSSHKLASGQTTHFKVKTQAGATGWFAWAGNDISGGVNSNCP